MRLSVLNKAKLASQPVGRPPAAVEVSPEGVLAAALPGLGRPPVYAFAPLPAGAVVPHIDEANLRPPETVVSAIRKALGEVSPRSHAITLILPDTVVRVFVLDFDTLPAKAAEAVPVLRFRLRKMIPFDVEHAGVSHQMLTQDKTECKVLTAVMPGPVLAEYEAAVRAAGYEPGVVLPSSLASLATINSMGAILAANLNTVSLTTSIVNGQDLLLYRTIDLPQDPDQRKTEIQRGIAVAAAYFEDKLQAHAEQLHYAGTEEATAFARLVDDAELAVIDMAPRPEHGVVTALGHTSVAGVAGALVGAS